MQRRLRPFLVTSSLIAFALVCAAAAFRFFGVGSRNGDYQVEADPSLLHGLRGGLLSLYDVDFVPLMWPFAIAVRLPFVWLQERLDVGGLLNGSHQPAWEDRYAVGAVACLVIAGVAVGLGARAVLASRRSLVRIGIVAAAVAAFVVSPLTASAIQWGHPEEALLAGLLAGSLLLFAAGRDMGAIVLAALAVATKQPALLVVPALFFMVRPGLRVKGALVGGAALIVATLPWVIGSLHEFLSQNRAGASSPVSMQASRPPSFWGVLGDSTGTLAGHSHLMIGVLALGMTLAVAARHSWFIPARAGSALVVAILALRCAGDNFNISYYAVPLGAALIALELMGQRSRWRGFPLWSLLGGYLMVGLSDWGGALRPPLERIGAQLPDLLFVALMVLIVAVGMWMALTVADLRETLRSRPRSLVYGVGGAVVLVMVLALVGSNHTPDPRLRPMFGWSATSVEALSETSPAARWWIGEAPVLGMDEMLLTVPDARKSDRTNLSSILYSRGEGLPNLSVYTSVSAEGQRRFASDLAACRAGSCRSGARLIETSTGTAIVRGSRGDWQLRLVPEGTGSVVAMIATDGPPAGRAARLLQTVGSGR